MSITQRVFTSSAFQVAINLAQRLIGIVSTLILARMLTPDDFGIIAILALTIHLIDILSDAGSQQYIIQKQNADDIDLNTAWSIDIIGKFTLTALICLIAPLIAETLDNPLLTDAIRIVSLSIPLRALRNPALILLAKEFDYQKLFKLNIVQKLSSFTAVMLVVAINPSYWAIVTGDIVAALIMLIGSYRIHAYRPKWALAKFREQWSFSQWALLRGLTGFGRSQADILIVSKLFPPAALGGYHLQRELALIPAFSLIIPAIEPLLSAIAKAKNDHQLLCYRLRLSMISLLALLIPLSVFIFLQSKLIVSVLLGEQWIQHHTLLGYFSLMFFAFCFHALISDCFTAINKMRVLFYFDLASTVVIISILLAFSNLEMQYFALARGLAGLLITMSLLFLLSTLTHFNLKKLILNTSPCVLATALSLISCQISITLLPTGTWDLLSLTFFTLVFFCTYLLTLLVITKVLASLLFTSKVLKEGSLNEAEQLCSNIVQLTNSALNKLKRE